MSIITVNHGASCWHFETLPTKMADYVYACVISVLFGKGL